MKENVISYSVRGVVCNILEKVNKSLEKLIIQKNRKVKEKEKKGKIKMLFILFLIDLFLLTIHANTPRHLFSHSVLH